MVYHDKSKGDGMKKRIVSGLVLGIISFALHAQNGDPIKRAPRVAHEDVPCDLPRIQQPDGQMVVLPYSVMVELVKVLDKVVDRAPRPDAPTIANVAYPVSFDCADIDLIRRCVCLIKQQLTVICTKLDFIIEEIASCCEALSQDFSVVEVSIANAVASICECIDLSNSAQSELLTSIIETTGASTAATACECIALSNSAQSELLTSIIETTGANTAATACECIALSNSAQSELLVSIIEQTNTNIAATVCDCVSSNVETVRADLASCCEKIGNLDDQGSCFDSQLEDIAAAINNANLTVIQWLKTIMLELRGCSC